MLAAIHRARYPRKLVGDPAENAVATRIGSRYDSVPMMTRAIHLSACCALLALVGGPGFAQASSLSWLSPELRRIETERRTLESTLATWPPAPAPQLTERLGHHSRSHASAEDMEWVEINMGKEEAIDAVVLVAAVSANGSPTSVGYGFPVRFRVEIKRDSQDDDGEIIADYTQEDFQNPGVLPVYLPAGGHRARFVRIVATRLYGEGGRHFLALGEVMILQGRRNLCARLSRWDVKTSSSMGSMPVWGMANLVDGHSVTGPPVGAQPSPSFGYQSKRFKIPRGETPPPAPRWVQVDLGQAVPVDEVRLFPAHPPEFAHRPGYGYPPGLKVELANDADSRDALQLPSFPVGIGSDPLAKQDPAMPGDNAVTFPAPGHAARFVRVTALRPFDAVGNYTFALSELQVWSGDTNVAMGKPVSAFDSTDEKGWSNAALVDGFTSQANILDWPDWLAGLSHRRETIQRLAMLDVQQTAVLARFKTIGWWLLGTVLAATLLALVGFHLRQRRERHLEMEALRQRIAQDLHDEIGSSLGSIAFISEDALALTQDETVRSELCEIRDTAEETLDSMRDLVRLMQSGRHGEGDLTGNLRGIARRMLRGIPHAFDAPASAAFNRLPIEQRSELVFMFKEALHNLARHAQATKADITLAQHGGALTLTVRDNGRGFDPSAVNGRGMGLTNLQRRATKHGGSVRLVSAPAQGTTLIITLPRHV
ncbi:MAG TPA: sensor histidine kinase [Candidatus Saccharimonadia bacterium]|nr:sensor histidine kinase [Candidatus Saccharimonadia bacterium]